MQSKRVPITFFYNLISNRWESKSYEKHWNENFVAKIQTFDVYNELSELIIFGWILIIAFYWIYKK